MGGWSCSFAAVKDEQASLSFQDRAKRILVAPDPSSGAREPSVQFNFHLDGGILDALAGKGLAVFEFRNGYPGFGVLTLEAARELLDHAEKAQVALEETWLRSAGATIVDVKALAADGRHQRDQARQFLASLAPDEVSILEMWDES